MQSSVDKGGSRVAYFIDDIIRPTRVPPDRATHFALYRGDRVRYYIALEDGMGRAAGRRLSANVSAYSGKLDGLMKLLGRIPYRALQLAHIGAYVSLELDGQVADALDTVRRDVLKSGKIRWNVLVGSYVQKQKAVFQCFCADDAPAVYMKVGDTRASAEMLAFDVQLHLFEECSDANHGVGIRVDVISHCG